MASLYKQKESKFFWIKYRDSATGEIKRKSTKLTELVRARKLCSEYTYKESQITAATSKNNWQWVDNFLEERYGTKKLRALCAWRMLKMFLDEYDLTAPSQITREHAYLYLDWRGKPNKSDAKYRAGRNTTILEIKFMSIILDESTRKQLCIFNPWVKLKLHRAPQKQKPELPRSALAKILWNIRKESEPHRTFFLNSFLLSRYHGCRLSETYLNPLIDIDMAGRPTISFQAKGDRVHSVYLHPKLIRRFKKMQRDRITQTYQPVKSPAKTWFLFLNRIGIKKEFPGACFHSLRVTAATTLARKGIPEKKAMDYIGHASTTVHRSYVRLKPEDLSVCADALD